MAERLSKHRLELGIVPIGALGMSIFCIDLYFIGSPWTVDAGAEAMGVVGFLQNWQAWRICIDLFLIASFGGIYSVPLYTLLQQRAEDGSRSARHAKRRGDGCASATREARGLRRWRAPGD